MYPVIARHFASRSTTTLTIAAIAIAISTTSPVHAATLTLGSLRFSEVSGDFQITGGRIEPNFYTIEQSVFGPNINLLMAIDGFPSLFPFTGIRVQTITTNNTGTPWIFFDHELREAPGIPSPEADGLSFAQGIRSVRPFRSDRFARVDEVTDVRDFVNFSGGIVAPGDRVVFQYAITDNSPINRFFLLQRPNFQPGGVGFVNPTPPPPPAVIPPPPAPPVVTPPVSEPPTSAEAVPEPSTVLGIIAALTGGKLLRRRRAQSQAKS